MERTPIFLNRGGGGWHLRPGRRYLLSGATLVLAAIFAVVAVDAWRQDKHAAAALLAVVGAAFLALGFPASPRRPPRLADDVTGSGLLLPTNAPGAGATGAMAVVGVLLVVGGAVGVSGGQWGGVGAVLAGCLAFVGVYAAVRARRTHDRGVLLLPGGVVLRTRRPPVRLAWSDIAGIQAHWRRRIRGAFPTPDELVHNWLTFEVVGAGQGVSMDPTTFAVDPEVALDVLQHYLDHPEDRAELGTEASLARVDTSLS